MNERMIEIATGSPLFFAVLDVLAARAKILTAEPDKAARIIGCAIEPDDATIRAAAYLILHVEARRPAAEWMSIPLAARAAADAEIARLNHAIQLFGVGSSNTSEPGNARKE